MSSDEARGVEVDSAVAGIKTLPIAGNDRFKPVQTAEQFNMLYVQSLLCLC